MSDVCCNVDNRISGRHCRIFCVRDPGSTGFHVFLENYSGNSTFVRTAANPSTFVSLSGKGTSRRLNSGDTVTLLCPKKVRESSILDKASYTYLEGTSGHSSLGAPRQSTGRSGGPGSQTQEAGGGESSGGLKQSFTAALHSNRAVSDVYDLQRFNELGRGQYGVVYKAVHRQTGMMWACKQLDARKAAFMQDEDSLLNEVRVLRGLKHHSIITTEDVFQDAESMYIIQVRAINY